MERSEDRQWRDCLLLIAMVSQAELRGVAWWFHYLCSQTWAAPSCKAQASQLHSKERIQLLCEELGYAGEGASFRYNGWR